VARPSGPSDPGNRRISPSEEPPNSRKRLFAVIAGAVVLVLVLAGVGFYLFGRDDDSKVTTARPSASSAPASSSPSASTSASPSTSTTDAAGKLGSRATDPQPLALTSLSQPTYTLSTSGSYARTGQDTDTNCGKAVDGAAVTTVVKLKCSQVTSVTAANAKTGCVVTFGALNFPDAATATQAETTIKGGTAGSFVPRRHAASVTAEGQAGRKDWWFYRKAYGHWLVFSTGAYTNGKVAAKDKIIDTCSQDFLYYVIEVLDKRG
jgi:hypothetical protein